MGQKARRLRQKPCKPYPSYPLTAHNNGQWCKKIRGKIHFFGTWDDPQDALNNYLQAAPDLHAGRQPQESLSADETTVKDVCNQFLTNQLRKEESGQITARWFEDCRRVAEHFVRFVGPDRALRDLGPKDFVKYRWGLVNEGLGGQKGLGVHALTRAVTIVRGMFKHAYDFGLLDHPMKYGGGLDRPSARVRRKEQRAARLANGKRVFEPSQARLLISEATKTPLRAMILLGINGGFGNTDCAQLPREAVNFDRAVIEFDRPKTGIERRVPLWPETLEAVQETMRSRPKPSEPEDEGLAFLTASGRPWIRARLRKTDRLGACRAVNVDMVSCQFDKLLRKLGLKRKGLGFYALRHTFRTWADEVNDQHAIHRIMGHVVPGMSGIYVQEISLDRLRRVVEHVRRKLFEEDSEQ